MDNASKEQYKDFFADIGPISWWSWRPGIKPRNALLFGCPLTLFALLLIVLGLSTLIAGIEDGDSAPLLIGGTVISRNTTGNSSQLRLQLQKTIGFPDIVAFMVPATVAQRIPFHAPVTVVYSQRLHFAYALEYTKQRYTIPGASAAGNPIGSLALLLSGLLILPYPALLAHWGWRDLLIERYDRDRLSKMTARIVSTRAVTRTSVSRPGFTGRGARPWYGIALLPPGEDIAQRVYTFSVSEEIYRSLHKGIVVDVVYTPHLQHINSIKQAEPGL